MMPNQQQLRLFFETAIIFLIAVLFATIFAGLWAKVFFDSWFAVSFQNELPNILMLSVGAVSLAVVLRHMPRGSVRTLFMTGLGILCFELLLEIGLKKYDVAYPTLGIGQWFFVLGILNFIGILALFLGFKRLKNDHVRPLSF